MYVFKAWSDAACLPKAAAATYTERYVKEVYMGPADPSTSSYAINTSMPTPATFAWLTPAQKQRAQALNTIFENGVLKVDYGYAQNLGDGRGITFGRAGFCTGTGDGLLVVKEYTAAEPNNILAKYLPALQAIENKRGNSLSADVTGLNGFIQAVAKAAKDPAFRKAQDDVNDLLYYDPSQVVASALGIEHALTKGQLMDSWINHGSYPVGDPSYPDSANALIDFTNELMGGSPADGVNEEDWLRAYLDRRWYVLASNDKTWAESVGRVRVYQGLVNAGAWELDKPIELKQGCCGASGVCAKTTSYYSTRGWDYGTYRIK